MLQERGQIGCGVQTVSEGHEKRETERLRRLVVSSSSGNASLGQKQGQSKTRRSSPRCSTFEGRQARWPPLALCAFLQVKRASFVTKSRSRCRRKGRRVGTERDIEGRASQGVLAARPPCPVLQASAPPRVHDVRTRALRVAPLDDQYRAQLVLSPPCSREPG